MQTWMFFQNASQMECVQHLNIQPLFPKRGRQAASVTASRPLLCVLCFWGLKSKPTAYFGFSRASPFLAPKSQIHLGGVAIVLLKSLELLSELSCRDRKPGSWSC